MVNGAFWPSEERDGVDGTGEGRGVWRTSRVAGDVDRDRRGEIKRYTKL